MSFYFCYSCIWENEWIFNLWCFTLSLSFCLTLTSDRSIFLRHSWFKICVLFSFAPEAYPIMIRASCSKDDPWQCLGHISRMQGSVFLPYCIFGPSSRLLCVFNCLFVFLPFQLLYSTYMNTYMYIQLNICIYVYTDEYIYTYRESTLKKSLICRSHLITLNWNSWFSNNVVAQFWFVLLFIFHIPSFVMWGEYWN